jgi:hypothetical protein
VFYTKNFDIKAVILKLFLCLGIWIYYSFISMGVSINDQKDIDNTVEGIKEFKLPNENSSPMNTPSPRTESI